MRDDAVIVKVLEVRSPRTAVNSYRVLSEMPGEAVRRGPIATTRRWPSERRGRRDCASLTSEASALVIASTSTSASKEWRSITS